MYSESFSSVGLKSSRILKLNPTVNVRQRRKRKKVERDPGGGRRRSRVKSLEREGGRGIR